MNLRGKVLAIFLASVLMIVMIAGCGEKTSEGTTGGGEKTIESTVQPENRTQMDISIWYALFGDFAHYKAISEDIIQDYILEKFAINVETKFPNQGMSMEERLQMLVASGEIPDVIESWYSQTNLFSPLIEADKIWKITPEIMEKYMPNTWSQTESLVKESYLVNEAPYNGSYQAIPYNSFNMASKIYAERYPEELKVVKQLYPGMDGSTRIAIAVRDDILKQIRPEAYSHQELVDLGLKNGNITEADLAKGGGYLDSFEELYKLLKDIKDLNIPDIIVNLTPGVDALQNLNYAVGSYFVSQIDWKNQEYPHLFDDVRVETYKQINRLFRDEIIPLEQYVLKREQLAEKIFSGNVATTFDSNAVGDLNQQAEDQGEPYRFRLLYISKVPSKEFDYRPVTNTPNLAVNISKTGAVKTEEDLKRILEFVDFFATDEYYEISMWGPKEAGLYEMVDGKKKYKSAIIEKQARTYVETDGEINASYYGLDLRWGNPGRLHFMPSYMNPQSAFIIYGPMQITKDSFWTYASNQTRNINGLATQASGLEWFARDTYVPLTTLLAQPKSLELKALEESLKVEGRAKLFTAGSDAEFDAILKGYQDQFAAAGWDDFSKEYVRLTIEWYEKNQEPLPKPMAP